MLILRKEKIFYKITSVKSTATMNPQNNSIRELKKSKERTLIITHNN